MISGSTGAMRAVIAPKIAPKVADAVVINNRRKIQNSDRATLGCGREGIIGLNFRFLVLDFRSRGDIGGGSDGGALIATDRNVNIRADLVSEGELEKLQNLDLRR